MAMSNFHITKFAGALRSAMNDNTSVGRQFSLTFIV